LTRFAGGSGAPDRVKFFQGRGCLRLWRNESQAAARPGGKFDSENQRGKNLRRARHALNRAQSREDKGSYAAYRLVKRSYYLNWMVDSGNKQWFTVASKHFEFRANLKIVL